MTLGICALAVLAPGTSVLLEAVWADILGRGTFSVLSFSYPPIALRRLSKYNTTPVFRLHLNHNLKYIQVYEHFNIKSTWSKFKNTECKDRGEMNGEKNFVF